MSLHAREYERFIHHLINFLSYRAVPAFADDEWWLATSNANAEVHGTLLIHKSLQGRCVFHRSENGGTKRPTQSKCRPL